MGEPGKAVTMHVLIDYNGHTDLFYSLVQLREWIKSLPKGVV